MTQTATSQSLVLVARLDLVLMITIARLEGLEEQFKNLFDAARKRFLTCPFDYADALGDLLPPDFMEIARDRAYSDGRNATAADDLPAFYANLEQSRADVATRGLLGMPTGLPILDKTLFGLRDHISVRHQRRRQNDVDADRRAGHPLRLPNCSGPNCFVR